MRITRIAAACVIAVSALAFTACSGSIGGDVIAPVTKGAGELEGTTVDLVVGQVLNIDTGDLAVDSYTATIGDPAVAEFVEGHEDATATFNPGITALAEGETEVTLSNSDGGIQDVIFTVHVTQ
ncbi:hypothetical protein ACFC3F_02665 [Microbacterium sp. NPDC055910]|uniref:hypothetical protein n=1 Tax=Microbacterium sp. NPDC055910 TaxID=3345659 RepID=UPI0035E06702